MGEKLQPDAVTSLVNKDVIRETGTVAYRLHQRNDWQIVFRRNLRDAILLFDCEAVSRSLN